MAFTKNASLALFLTLNILFFSMVVSATKCPGTKTPPVIPKVPSSGKCPKDALKLGVCADVLNLVKNVVVGSPPTLPCCALLNGLVDLEAALCLCTAIKANVLGLKLNVPVALSLVLNNCGKKVPNGFECS
ncbi:14 kDa proline-rich protein DC2.15-like [Apium graveolens]|uniref:14 kDa proline-rich protein DC2.15-like n=1 Tax=Apium graveolens TaxID=4045 RepID=UPI003D7B8C81